MDPRGALGVVRPLLVVTAIKSTVGVDAADHGCSDDHEPGLIGSEEGALVGQVELSVSAQDKVGEA